MQEYEEHGAVLIKSQAQLREERENQERRRERRRNNLQLLFNGILMVATVITLMVVARQNRILNESLNEMRKQSTAAARSAKAAEDAISQSWTLHQSTIEASQRETREGIGAQREIALQQLAAANKAAADQLAWQRDAMRLERRAWIGADRALKPVVEVGSPMTVGVEITNTGATPGLRVETTNQIEPVARGRTFKPALIRLAKRPSSSALLPGMRMTASVTSSWVVTESVLASIRSRDINVYLYGKIAYRDVFGLARESGYCMILEPDLSAFRFCDTHNYAR